MEKEEIIIYYGGTFDPVHKGHTAIARTGRDFIRKLFPGFRVKVMLVPAPVPPHKAEKKITPLEIRFAMLSSALAGEEALEASNFEEGRNGKSYTIDSLTLLQEKHPAARIFLLIGGDSLLQFHTWKDARRLNEKFSILTFPRPGAEIREDLLPSFWSRTEKEKLLSFLIPRQEEELFPVSSTFLRENFYSLSPELLLENLSPNVIDFIKKHHLYT